METLEVDEEERAWNASFWWYAGAVSTSRTILDSRNNQSPRYRGMARGLVVQGMIAARGQSTARIIELTDREEFSVHFGCVKVRSLIPLFSISLSLSIAMCQAEHLRIMRLAHCLNPNKVPLCAFDSKRRLTIECIFLLRPDNSTSHSVLVSCGISS